MEIKPTADGRAVYIDKDSVPERECRLSITPEFLVSCRPTVSIGDDEDGKILELLFCGDSVLLDIDEAERYFSINSPAILFAMSDYFKAAGEAITEQQKLEQKNESNN